MLFVPTPPEPWPQSGFLLSATYIKKGVSDGLKLSYTWKTKRFYRSTIWRCVFSRHGAAKQGNFWSLTCACGAKLAALSTVMVIFGGTMTNEQFIKSIGFRRAEHWELDCPYCNGIEDGNHYCLVHSIPIKNAELMRCDSFERSPDKWNGWKKITRS